MRRLFIKSFVAVLLGGLCSVAVAQTAGKPAPMSMVLVPGGELTPLFRAEQDPKVVKVEPFYLEVFPVSNSEFLEFVRAHPKWRRSEVKRIFADSDYLKAWAGDLEPGSGVLSNAPVTYVSWFAAKAYASWKGKRLPSTAEWEYAANASATRPDGEKDPEFVRKVQDWYSTASPMLLPAVGLSGTNFFGVCDLHGLVWEWVADFNTTMVTGDARGDTGLDRQLFCAGGSQNAKDRNNFPAYMRYGFRSSLKASYTVHNLGFRCAQSLKEGQ